MATEDRAEEKLSLIETGVPGLDGVLHGGLARNRMYLLEGDPGTGKTTLALQFLLAGCHNGEPCLYVTLSESEEELRASAASHGWGLDGVNVLEIPTSQDGLIGDARYTMFHPSEVELGETIKTVLAEAERIKPTRLAFDALSDLRLLAENAFRHRRQILALKQYFSRQQCTVMFLDDRSGERKDLELHSLVHGVINLGRQMSDYGTIRRRLQVIKLRGRAFREGCHDMLIKTGGIEVFPRLIAAEHHTTYPRQTFSSGLAGLDALLGGGLTKGTTTLLLGTAGTGKSSIATQFVCSTAGRGERAAFFLFDESVESFLERSTGLDMDVRALIKEGSLNIRRIDPAELSPGEFAHQVRQTLELDNTRMVVIDSLNGYLNAMPSERFLMLHLHELTIYLGQQGVTTLLIMNQSGIIGNVAQAPIDASYLADIVILLRYFEAVGEVRKALSVIKKRTGDHEKTIRELRFNHGIQVGEPVREFQGVLSGQPELIGQLAATNRER